MKAISSAANPRYRQWLRIATMPRAVRLTGQTLAEGLHLAQAALAARYPIEALILRETSRHPEVEQLLDHCDPAIPRYALPAGLYEALAPVEQGAGILLLLAVPAAEPAADSGGDAVYLDGVQDPGNVGAILRTAAAAGIVRVMASSGTAALWSPRVLRGAMGAHFRLRLHEGVGVAELAQRFAGPWVVAQAHDAPSLWQADLPQGPLGWILGSEGSGPSAQALELARLRVCIPTSGAVESLNVGAAAAVCFFERRRRLGF